MPFLLVGLFCWGAGAIADPAADPQGAAQARQVLAKASAFMESISTEGGFVWNYASDLSQRAGESPCPATMTWNESPGTAAVGGAFLRGWKATGDAQLLEDARAAAIALQKCQLPSGGWHYSGSFDPALPNKDGAPDYKGLPEQAEHPGQPIYPLHCMATTFDDGVTQNTTQFLIEYVAATKSLNDPKDEPVRQTLDRALNGMFNAQYPNGAWPERYFGKKRNLADYPVRKAEIADDWPRKWSAEREWDYQHYYTLNDRCQRDCIDTMLLAWKLLGRQDCLDSAKRGGDFLILSQFPAPQAGWAQQYNFQMRPAWGRAWEVPGLCSNESRTAIEALMDLYLATGEEKYLKPIEPALAWLERSKLGPNKWARYYELGTNKPMYGRLLDKKSSEIVYAPATARKGYSWEGDFRIASVAEKYAQLKKLGREAYKATLEPKPATAEDFATRKKQASKMMSSLDDNGRWLVRGKVAKGTPELDQMISTSEFINNAHRLSAYIEMAEKPMPPAAAQKTVSP